MNIDLHKEQQQNPMRCLFLAFFCSLLLVVLHQTASSDDQFDSLFYGHYYESVADRLYDSKEIPGNLLLALEYYKKASNYLSTNSEVEWKIGRCYWVLATKTVKEEDRLVYFKEGIRYGKLGVKNNPDSSNAHLWLSLIVGSSAMDQGVVRTLYNREMIKSGLETALRINPSNTNAYVGLAGWYFHVPKFLGGDREKAFQYINRAIRIEPDYTSARLVKAEFLLQENRHPEAIRTLKEILNIKKPAIRGDGVENVNNARKMLDQLKAEGFSG
ncbi:tetratricopeptide repeat protein [bacterium]|nr:tetratricopeptide repeat protein [bacterium]